MNDPFKNRFKLQIESLTGFDFQDFVIELFLQRFGPSGFTVLRSKKDKGCDGIINSEQKVVACYGPRKYNQSTFTNKVEEDFEDYKKNWQKQYPNWMVIVNHSLAPFQITKVNKLKSGSTIIGITNILALIEELPNYKKRILGRYLKIEEEFFVQDYIQEILDDLLKNSDSEEPRKPYSKPLYFSDKVKLNYEQLDITDILSEYDVLAEYFSDISNLINGYEDDEIDKIKHKIISDFSQIKGTFKDRLEELTLRYLMKYSIETDSDFKFYIRALLIYMFEQCLIGDKTNQENATASSGK